MVIRLRGRIFGLHLIKPFHLAIFVIILILLVSPCFLLVRYLIGRLSTNYLTPPDNHFYTGDFLVNNPKCRIPNITIFHEHTIKLLNDQSNLWNCQDFRTEGIIKGLTYVRNQALIFNESVLLPFGIKLKDIECCYHVVLRVGRNDSDFVHSLTVDDQFKYSRKCYQIQGPVAFPHEGFIRVTCDLINQTGYQLIAHRAFHLLAVIPNKTESYHHRRYLPSPSSLSRKLNYWKNLEHHQSSKPPMNVLLIGLDSMSRMHFRRMLQSTTSLLTNELSAFEMKGFTKVGENTIANFVPLMTSLFVKELESSCNIESITTPFDDCPFLWKNFSERNYLTGHIEDYPDISIFNYWMGGFDKEPVDFYPRAWMVAAYKERNGSYCISHQRPDQIILQYTQDLMALAKSKKIPFFITTWLTELTHNSISDASRMDTTLKNSLISMKTEGLLENTLLIVMGDHGYRYLNIRRTLTGYYEDKLPALWIRLPDRSSSSVGYEILEKMKAALEHNSRQLVTPFDIHATLKDILDLQNWTSFKDKPSERGRGLSLLDKLPERNCTGAGVPREYCVCTGGIMEYSLDKNEAEVISDAIIRKINEGLPSVFCAKLETGRITGVGFVWDLLPEPEAEKGERKMTAKTNIYDGTGSLVIGLQVLEMPIYLEAVVRYDKEIEKFVVGNIVRTNRRKGVFKICVPDELKGVDMFCHCLF